MGLKQLESSILGEAKTILCNPKMKLKELHEWSTGKVKPQDGEIAVYLPEHKVNIAVPVACDKRVQEPA